LPDWLPAYSVPQQETTGGSADRGNAAGTGRGNDLSIGSVLQHSSRSAAGDGPAWEQIQRHLSRREFAGAQRAIAGIADTRDRAAIRLRYTRELLAAAEVGQARNMLDACLTEDPLLIAAQLLRASLAEEAGDLAAAERYYRQALYIDRNCPIAHFHLALVQQQQGHASAAARSLRTTLKLAEGEDPHSLVAHGEGVCYGRLKELVLLLKENLA
jgi:tetratricopeptide (TPR) repeat protein